jgi:hypothetical protein
MTSRAQKALSISCLLYYVLVAVGCYAGGSEQEVMTHARSPLASMYVTGSILALVVALVAVAGLLARKRWAAYVHVAATVFIVVCSYSADAPLPMGPMALLSVAIYVLTGIIYGLAFFTDALVDSDEKAE